MKKKITMMFALLAAMMMSTAQTPVFMYDFENGIDSVSGKFSLGDWTTIDADGDGFDWFNGHDLGTLMGHNETDGFAISESAHYPYALSPDNYLVSPRFYAANNSFISFYACSHDLYYPLEHFGVAVSTASNNNPEDFVTIAEWTIPDTGEGDGQTPYLEYSADLSAYAGQQIYIAIRHFNCYDQYKLDIDDITIVADTMATGISENNDAFVKIFPNPTNDFITVSADEMSRVTVFNAAAQMVLDRFVGKEIETIDLSSLPVGTYVVRVTTKEGVISREIIKK